MFASGNSIISISNAKIHTVSYPSVRFFPGRQVIIMTENQSNPDNLRRTEIFANSDIVSVIAGIPGNGHKHLRTIIETSKGTLVFQEATMAALVRAYIHVKTHPCDRAVYLEGRILDKNKKPDYASWQLLENSLMTQEEIDEKIRVILGL
jgi:hypothetical protein